MLRFVFVVLILVTSKAQSTPVEFRQRPPFAGQTSGGPLGQLIPSGNLLPAGETGSNLIPEGFSVVELGNRNKETPLEYKPEKPFFAGSGSIGGPLPQIIPPGPPWPASAEGYNKSELLGNRIQETSSTKPDNSSGSENNPNRPSFAGTGIIGGPLPQIVPTGQPWPANPQDYNKTDILGNRIQDNSPQKTNNSTNLENNPNRPFFAGTGLIGGPLTQIIPSGPPLPSNPNNNMMTSTLENRFEEFSTEIPKKTTTSGKNTFTEEYPDLENEFPTTSPPPKLLNTNKMEALLALFIPTSK